LKNSSSAPARDNIVQLVGFERRLSGLALDGSGKVDLVEMERASDQVVSALCPQLLQVRVQGS